MDDAIELWERCSKYVQDRLNDAAWKTWFADVVPVRLDHEALVLAAPNQFAKSRLEQRYQDLLRDALDHAAGPDLHLVVLVDPSAAKSEPPITSGASEADDETTEEDEAPLAPVIDLAVNAPAPVAPSTSPTAANGRRAALNPRYTFANFVIGKSNRFAHAAALSVAETPAQSYNPLFIYGSSGLGKTHLLHAIGHYVHEHYPTYRVRYVSTEQFVNELIESIRNNTQPAFKRHYRECEVLLIDDIQFIGKSDATQEEFFHTFNHLHQHSRQIIISSDRPPEEIPTLEERLRNRFRWGLLTDVKPPDLETRLAILRSRAEHDTVTIDDDVLTYIGEHITDNIRELEGALIRITAYATLYDQTVTRDIAEKILEDVITTAAGPRRISMQDVVEESATLYGYSVEELIGPSRRRPIVSGRQVAMYVIRELTDHSLPEIADFFGGRDHTTVLHAVKKIEAEMKTNHETFQRVQSLLSTLKKRRDRP